eukprot:CAMPEP_0204601956 /NCGR_PEP_ID=MMETSP0661-20131031/56367_1 /ASSEMBLY_ACC=CAM_ASM_000606 /TAXON_ID=109239 /ORGANISM="Alexandrium margalefi, Strain AMGDE01CS-322" /LENGTH=43 /DNA_ID= /DNA_START= /DNA_END= /DNA_ORIENTATION=
MQRVVITEAASMGCLALRGCKPKAAPVARSKATEKVQERQAAK